MPEQEQFITHQPPLVFAPECETIYKNLLLQLKTNGMEMNANHLYTRQGVLRDYYDKYQIANINFGNNMAALFQICILLTMNHVHDSTQPLIDWMTDKSIRFFCATNQSTSAVILAANSLPLL